MLQPLYILCVTCYLCPYLILKKAIPSIVKIMHLIGTTEKILLSDHFNKHAYHYLIKSIKLTLPTLYQTYQI